jgi:hypothetical protein
MTHWTNPGDTEPPIPVVTSDGRIRLVPRHLDAHTAELGAEWLDWTQEPTHRAAIRQGGTVGDLVDNEGITRWDNFVDAAAPVLRTRADVVRLIAALHAAMDDAFPVAPAAPRLSAAIIMDEEANL